MLQFAWLLLWLLLSSTQWILTHISIQMSPAWTPQLSTSGNLRSPQSAFKHLPESEYLAAETGLAQAEPAHNERHSCISGTKQKITDDNNSKGGRKEQREVEEGRRSRRRRETLLLGLTECPTDCITDLDVNCVSLAAVVVAAPTSLVAAAASAAAG